jgi:hypothetical protein
VQSEEDPWDGALLALKWPTQPAGPATFVPNTQAADPHPRTRPPTPPTHLPTHPPTHAPISS